MMYRNFVVFAFVKESDMELFKRSKCMEYVADKKIGALEVGDAYKMTEVMDLFEEIYPCYIIYELIDGVEEMVLGKNLRKMDAS